MDSWQLADGTVLLVNPRDWKMAKKFGEYQYFGALLLTLFPYLYEPIAETMYAYLVTDEDVLNFTRTVIAAQMVHDQYGDLPEFFFDHLYACSINEIFYMYAWNGDVMAMCDQSDARLRQLTINPDAVHTLKSLLLDASRVEPCDPEPVLFVEDATPGMLVVEKSQSYVYANGSCPHECDIDYLCWEIQQGTVQADLEAAIAMLDHDCKMVPPWRYAVKQAHLFSSVLSFDYNRVLVFGTSFKQLDLRDVSERVKQRRTGDWYLCRVRWFPPSAHVKASSQVQRYSEDSGVYLFEPKTVLKE